MDELADALCNLSDAVCVYVDINRELYVRAFVYEFLYWLVRRHLEHKALSSEMFVCVTQAELIFECNRRVLIKTVMFVDFRSDRERLVKHLQQSLYALDIVKLLALGNCRYADKETEPAVVLTVGLDFIF